MIRWRSPSTIAAILTLYAAPACGPQRAPAGELRPVSSSPPAVDVPVASAGASAPALPKRPDARALLLPYVVTDTKPARATLFTWTTAEQADELAKNKVLLTRSESPKNGASYFDQMLAERAKDPQAKLAALLRTKAYAKHRYAWASPWPTRLGWPGETYGDILVRIVLKPEALLVKMRASSGSFEVIDMEGNVVPVETALASPQRIAAAYFVQDVSAAADAGSWATRAAGRLGYREYVVFNESMVAEWSTGTPHEHDALERSIAAVEAFATTANGKANEANIPWNARVVRSWTSDLDPAADVATVYEAALAIPSESYMPQSERLRELVKTLGKAGDTSPLTHASTAVFPADQARVTQPPPRTVPPKRTPQLRGGSH